jgi:hypothetical protein
MMEAAFCLQQFAREVLVIIQEYKEDDCVLLIQSAWRAYAAWRLSQMRR